MSDPLGQARLVIGNRNTATWSFAVWMVLEHSGLPFGVEEIDLYAEDAEERLERVSPGGTLPVLRLGDARIWEALAIAEWAAEQAPALWPEDALLRGQARSTALEALYGMPDLLTFLPMDLGARFSPPGRLLRPVERDLAHLFSLWKRLLTGPHRQGAFLFGAFSIADAFMAPIVARLLTHGIPVDDACLSYVRAVSGLETYRRWQKEAELERSAVPPTTSETAARPEARPSSPVRSPTIDPKAPPTRPKTPPDDRPEMPATPQLPPLPRARAPDGKQRPPAIGPAVGSPSPDRPTQQERGTASRPAAPQLPTRRPAPPPAAAAGRSEEERPAVSSARKAGQQRERGPIVKPIGGGIRRRR